MRYRCEKRGLGRYVQGGGGQARHVCGGAVPAPLHARLVPVVPRNTLHTAQVWVIREVGLTQVPEHGAVAGNLGLRGWVTVVGRSALVS